jgi:ankyrin repeat protein
MNRPIARAMSTHVRMALLLSALAVSVAGCGFVASSHHNSMDYKAVDAAAEGGDLEALKSILARDPTLLQSKEWGDLTPLHLAVLHNHNDVAQYLLSKGADVNARTSTGITPLHEAAQNGNKEITELLLAHAASVNAVDNQGWTPMTRAQKWGHPEIAALLQQHGGHQ